jgi:hypothetical protein
MMHTSFGSTVGVGFEGRRDNTVDGSNVDDA